MTLAQSKPRGFYTDKSFMKWSKDTQTGYYNSAAMLYYWPLAKFAGLVLVFVICNSLVGCWQFGALVCLALTMFYQHLVALVFPNTIVMPVMDSVCLVSTEQSLVHYMNHSQYDSADASSME